ncbi:leucine-rich repeat domain-containing protein, partial [Bifidobacterium boum]|uniref:leucine-rich repeat domain-containing protein n=1 Tax=Bifidobacterium boum TaxID=78343 RepID=UPI0039922ACC
MGVARGRCWAAGVVAGVLACVLAVAPSASADVPDAPVSGVSQCVPDRSTIAQCFPDKALAQSIAKQVKGDANKTGEVLTSADVNNTTRLFAPEGDSHPDSSIAGVQGLQVFTKLEDLYLSNTRVSDVSLTSIAKLTGLRALYLKNTRVSDISPLAKLKRLYYLDLSNTKVSLSAVSKLSSLGALDLSNTQVSDVSPLAKLTNLYHLDLSNTQVSDISSLAKLTTLRGLDLSGTHVSDASPLAKLTNLSDYLDLSGTRVSDVSPLAGMTNLWHLDLSKTQVSNVSPLAGLTGLGSLVLSGTRVSDVSPLAKLAKLEYLDLSGTGVLDLGVLHGLSLSGGCNASGVCATSFAGVRPSAGLTVNADGSVSMPAPRWLDGTWVAPSSTSPAGGVLDAKRGVVTWKKYDAGASYSYDFKRSFTVKTEDGAGQAGAVEFSGHVTGVKPAASVVFRDVSSSTPHASDIAWLADAGVSTGWREPDGSYSFRGMDSVKRQDMAAFLRREAKRLGAGDAASWRPSDADWKQFRDVSPSTPHAEDILWLAHANVSEGWREPDGSRTFRGMDPVRRQDMAAFLR